MDQSALTERIRTKLGDKVVAHIDSCGQQALTIRPADLRDTVMFLRDDPDIAVNVLIDVGGVDYSAYDGWPHPWRFEVAYQFLSMTHGHRYRIKVAVADESTEVPTIWDLWRVANWMEREVWDMYGVRFKDHPNLRRILCHEDFKGHALRKDYPINKRQVLTRPVENLLTDDPEWA